MTGLAPDRLRLYHNPACSKSRGALELLRERGAEPEVVEYLKTPPSRAEIERILELLGGEPAQLVRRDRRFAELGLDEAALSGRDAVVELLLAHPELMQRPVAIRGDRAVLGRPSEKVLELL